MSPLVSGVWGLFLVCPKKEMMTSVNLSMSSTPVSEASVYFDAPLTGDNHPQGNSGVDHEEITPVVGPVNIPVTNKQLGEGDLIGDHPKGLNPTDIVYLNGHWVQRPPSGHSSSPRDSVIPRTVSPDPSRCS